MKSRTRRPARATLLYAVVDLHDAIPARIDAVDTGSLAAVIGPKSHRAPPERVVARTDLAFELHVAQKSYAKMAHPSIGECTGPHALSTHALFGPNSAIVIEAHPLQPAPAR